MFVVRRGAVVASGSFSRCAAAACGGDPRPRRLSKRPLSRQRAPERPRLLSARDEAPPVSATRAVAAEARPFSPLRRKFARTRSLLLGALMDRMRLLAGEGRSCRARAAGGLFSEGFWFLHGGLRGCGRVLSPSQDTAS